PHAGVLHALRDLERQRDPALVRPCPMGIRRAGPRRRRLHAAHLQASRGRTRRLHPSGIPGGQRAVIHANPGDIPAPRRENPVMNTTSSPPSDGSAPVELMRTMLRIRAVEKAWGVAYLAEEITGIPPSLSTGQEAIAAGACAALDEGDFVFTTHRGQAAQVARGLDLRRILAELYCRRSGYNKGKSYHVTDFSRGVIGMG